MNYLTTALRICDAKEADSSDNPAAISAAERAEKHPRDHNYLLLRAIYACCYAYTKESAHFGVEIVEIARIVSELFAKKKGFAAVTSSGGCILRAKFKYIKWAVCCSGRSRSMRIK